jgi:hypothetical protein
MSRSVFRSRSRHSIPERKFELLRGKPTPNFSYANQRSRNDFRTPLAKSGELDRFRLFSIADQAIVSCFGFGWQRQHVVGAEIVRAIRFGLEQAMYSGSRNVILGDASAWSFNAPACHRWGQADSAVTRSGVR